MHSNSYDRGFKPVTSHPRADGCRVVTSARIRPRFVLSFQRNIFWQVCVFWRHERGTGFSGLRFILGGLAGNMGNVNQHFTTRALYFPAGKLLVAEKVLYVMLT